jgi:hypothetical protein
LENASEKKANAGRRNPTTTLESAVSILVQDQIKDLLKSDPKISRATHTKRLMSEREDSDEEDAQVGKPPAKQTKNQPEAPQNQNKSNMGTEYTAQVVILEGVKEEIKSHPIKLSKAFADVKPNVELKPGGLRLTASGDVLVMPKNPKDT